MEPKPGDLLKIRWSMSRTNEEPKYAYVIFISRTNEFYINSRDCCTLSTDDSGTYTLLNMKGIYKISARALQRYFDTNYMELCVLHAPDDATNSPGS